jgi:hypothetical protein
MGEGLNDNEQLAKDVSYAPASGRETARLQSDTDVPDDVDAEAVKALPGTGGPDDGGDIEVDPEEIHIPHRAQH